MVIMSSASPPGSACRQCVRAWAGPEWAEDPLVVDGLQRGPRPDHADVALRVGRVQGEQRGRVSRDSRGVKDLIFQWVYCHQVAYDWEENNSKILRGLHGAGVEGSGEIVEVSLVGEYLYVLPHASGTLSRAY